MADGCGTVLVPILLTARSKAWVCDSSLAGIAGWNLVRGMDVSDECCVLSDTGLCGVPIPRPEESLTTVFVIECDRAQQ